MVDLYTSYIEIKNIIHNKYNNEVSKILKEVYDKAYSYLKASADAKNLIDIKDNLKDL